MTGRLLRLLLAGGAVVAAAAAPAAADPAEIAAAERAFAAAAAAEGQWTAFRRYAAPEAVMFVPQPVNAQDFLRDRADPPASVAWGPGAVWTSCDGDLGVSTGPWHRPDGSTGYFSTVWSRQPDGGWRWLLDHGDALSEPRAETAEPAMRVAACTDSPPAMPPMAIDDASGGGASADGTLRWRWTVTGTGARTVRVELWDGERFETVLEDRVAAPR